MSECSFVVWILLGFSWGVFVCDFVVVVCFEFLVG